MKWNKKIIEIGGSYGIIMPLELMKYVDLKLGDEIVLTDDDGKHGKFVSLWKKEGD